MSTNLEILNTDQVESRNIELGRANLRNIGDFEYEEIAITYLGKDFVVVTPNLLTYGIKENKTSYTSYSIGLRIVDKGEKNRAFLDMLQDVVDECGGDGRVG